MKAVVLAGGKGTRLRPYTATIPKPLMPIGESTIVEILLQQLARFGVTDATLCIGHQAALIEAVLGDGSRYGLRIRYYREEEPLVPPQLDLVHVAGQGGVDGVGIARQLHGRRG